MTVDLPHGWSLLTLGEICRRSGGFIQTGPFGSQLHASDYTTLGVPVVMPVNIGENRIVEDGIARVPKGEAARLQRHKLRPGNVVYSRRGDIGRRALISDAEDGWLCGTGCLRIDFGAGVLDSKFATYHLSNPDTRNWIVRHAVGTTMPNLNTAILSAIPFVVPSLHEQIKIGEVLGCLDGKIELNRRVNHTLESIAGLVFCSWFVDFDPVTAKAKGRQPPGISPDAAAMFPSRFRESQIGPVPEGWSVQPIGELLELNPLRQLKQGLVAPYLEMANVSKSQARVVAWENRPFSSGMRFRNGDVLLARITPCLEHGKTAYVDFLDHDQIGWGSTEYIVLRSKVPLPTEYAYFLARSEGFRAHAITNMTGSSGRQRVSASSLADFPVVCPPVNITREFGTVAKAALAKMKSNDEESASLAALRDALIPKLMSGELRVRDAEKQVGEHV